ncbi:formate dehydrogenase subunit alpha [Desulfotomaculum varum]
MSDITCMINDRVVTVPRGTTILAAANMLGIDIPTFCHDPALSRYGGCRICVVEVQGWQQLPASCVTEVRPGMAVYTESARVLEARRTILELMLANHPSDCLTCEKTGTCRLQEYAYRYRVKKGVWQGAVRTYDIETDNPFIIRDMNKCILCGKCVRVCSEVVGRSVIDYSYRGFRVKVATPLDLGLSKAGCVFCGSCVEVCPVGALTDKTRLGKGRTWELTSVTTTCPYCGVGCQIDLLVKDNRVVGAKAAGHGVNGRHLCVKGRYGHQFIHHPQRLTNPLVKKNGRFQEVSWDEAIRKVAEGFQQIKQLHGGRSIAVLSSARITNEENYLLNKLARLVLGTNHIDHCARLCHAPTVAGLAAATGSGAMTNPMKDIAGADLILAIGTNTTETHPVLSLFIRQAIRRGAVLVVVDPRKTELAKLAAIHLPIKPGTDIALFNSMVNVIIEENLWDKQFVEERCEGWPELIAAVREYTPAYAQEVTGIPADTVRQVARAYATAGRAAILYTMGLTQHVTGTDNVLAVANLALLCGQIGRASTGINPLRGQNNVQGACDMGALPQYLPGYQPVWEESCRKKFSNAWGGLLSSDPGMTVGEMMQAACQGELKGMYIVGENPVISDADANHVTRALNRLDFLVVQDIFLTETAQLADVVLPAASWAEKDGTFTNTERRVQRVRQAIPQVGNSKADWQIFCALAEAMGRPMRYQQPREIFDEMAALTPAYAGISYDLLDKGGIQWPCPNPDHPGTGILHQENFVRGKGKFHAVAYRPPDELPDRQYPLLLNTGRRLFHYHTGSMTLRTGLKEIYPVEYLDVNNQDARELGLVQRDRVKVISRRGEVIMQVRLTDEVPRGMVFTSFHFPDAAVNKLTNGARCPRSHTPELKVCAVRLEKLIQ